MKSFKIFFAGELFDHKHLTGNLLLAEKINMLSEGKYKCALPQDIDADGLSSNEIRVKDLELLISCDAVLFNFDGADLDSGTVLEFTAAKALRKPAVLFRTDMRAAGDQQAGCDQWNLMCSGYPQTATLSLNAMALYHKHLKQNPQTLLQSMHEELAGMLISKFDEVMPGTPHTVDPDYLARLRESLGLPPC
ncbi:nucleoside 2-deoxyribosyltransferase [Lentisphaerota bacterium ZTH]|nr:nucleoside 2-deoxyribosyltransferase [Lentisphaerota bacterium]WET05388.1 nucleoside 2-deoxyribosyltransferase [Lentisphaerota bacterium ZTH]